MCTEKRQDVKCEQYFLLKNMIKDFKNFLFRHFSVLEVFYRQPLL